MIWPASALSSRPGQRAPGLGLGALLVLAAQAAVADGVAGVAVARRRGGAHGRGHHRRVSRASAPGPATTSKASPGIGWRWLMSSIVCVQRAVGGAGDEHRRALVGEHQPVALERADDGQRRAAVGRLVEGGLQPPARAVGRGGGVGRGPAVARRRLPGAPRARQREAQGVADGARGGLVVAQQPGEDGQPGRVGRGPAGRPAPVAGEVPARRRGDLPRRPAVAAHGVVELVVDAALALDDDHVAVALLRVGLPGRRALDRRRGRDREGPVVALVAVVGAVGAEGDRHAALLRADQRVGDAVLRLRVAEVQVDVVAGGLRAHQGGGVGGQRRRADVGVPWAVGRQDGAAADDRPAGDDEGRARRARAPAARPQAVAALGDAAAQADAGAGVARGGDAAPVDRQRLRQPAGDVDDRASRAGARRRARRGPRPARRERRRAARRRRRAGRERTPRQASARLGRPRPRPAAARARRRGRRSAAAGRSSARSARPAGRGRSPRGRSARRRAAIGRRGA